MYPAGDLHQREVDHRLVVLGGVQALDNASYDRSGSLGVLGTARALPVRLGVQSEEHDHRAGGRGESDGAAGELAPQPSRRWRHDGEDPRSGHQLQHWPLTAQLGDDQFSQPPVDRRAEFAAHCSRVPGV